MNHSPWPQVEVQRAKEIFQERDSAWNTKGLSSFFSSYHRFRFGKFEDGHRYIRSNVVHRIRNEAHINEHMYKRNIYIRNTYIKRNIYKQNTYINETHI